MKNKVILTIISFVLLIVVIMFVWHSVVRQEERKELSDVLGVDSRNYSNSFPIDYFLSKLKDGMSIDQVHQLVIGFTKAYSCGESSELYLYYDESIEKALRFSILYDKEVGLNYLSLMYADQNSGYPNVNDCSEGLLSNNLP